MLASDQFARPHKEYLYDGILPLLCQCNDVLVIHLTCIGNLLLLHAGTDTPQQITVFCRLFKFHICCRFLHLLGQHLLNLAIGAVQKVNGSLDAFLIFLLRNLAGTDTRALLHMVIQTRSALTEIIRELLVAGAQMVDLLHQINGILDSRRAGKRSEIFCLVLFQLTRKKDSGVSFSQRHFDIRIGLIVTKHSIILWAMLLDQIAL